MVWPFRNENTIEDFVHTTKLVCTRTGQTSAEAELGYGDVSVPFDGRISRANHFDEVNIYLFIFHRLDSNLIPSHVYSIWQLDERETWLYFDDCRFFKMVLWVSRSLYRLFAIM